ncbi:MAG TPA: alpha/beta fold hydrolase, partial [Rhizomicrobium sp.]|nr:alpha/beta fold hydrolase [Rhizomicrobium sp.]
WLESHPVPDLFSTMPYEFPALLFHDVQKGTELLTAGMALDNPEWLKGFLVTNARQMGMAGRILFPIPDRGLATRLYRIKARTILIWGDHDRLIAPAYAEAFKAKIAGAELVMVKNAGHMVTLEKTQEVLKSLARLD